MFRRVRLSEIGDIVAGGTPKTKVEAYWNGNISWITPKDLSNHNNIYIQKGERCITKKGLENSSAKLLPKGTVLFTSRAPIGYIAIAENDVTTNQGFKSIIVNDKNDNIFIYYLLKNNVHRIENFASGSTFKEISGKAMKDLEFDIPSLGEQKAISKILYSIDKKIETNNQINKTLENMAQAIFNNWFVEFEFPNEDGEPYKSSGGEMIESELGMIPKGWKVIGLCEYINIKHGYAFKSKYFSKEKTNRVLMTPGNFKIGGGFKDDKKKYYEETAICPDDYILSQGDLIITMTDLSKAGDTLGYPAYLPNMSYTMLHNQRVGKVEIFNDFLTKEFLYYVFCSRDYRGHVLGSATGTTVKHTAPKRIMSFKVALPLNGLIKNYSELTRNTFKEINRNLIENRVLEEIRDTLLPKLMSGEIRVTLGE